MLNPGTRTHSVEAELTAILRGESQSGAAGGDDGEEGEGGEEGDECGSPDLDESLDSHFNYIQKVSAPQVRVWLCVAVWMRGCGLGCLAVWDGRGARRFGWGPCVGGL